MPVIAAPVNETDFPVPTVFAAYWATRLVSEIFADDPASAAGTLTRVNWAESVMEIAVVLS